jgi:hypothetical protein
MVNSFKKKKLITLIGLIFLLINFAFASAPVTSFNYINPNNTVDANITLRCTAVDSNCLKLGYRINSGTWTTINNTSYSGFTDTNFSQFEGANIAADGWTTHNGAPVTAAAAVKEGAKGYSSAGGAFASKAVNPNDTNYTFWLHCADGGINNSNRFLEFDWDSAAHVFGSTTNNGVIFSYATNSGSLCIANLKVLVGAAATYTGAITTSPGWKKGQIIINDNNTAKIYLFDADGTTLLDSNTNVILPAAGLKYVRLMTENNTRYNDAIHTFTGIKNTNFDYNFQYSNNSGTYTIDYNSTAVDLNIETTKTSTFIIASNPQYPGIDFNICSSKGFVNNFDVNDIQLTCTSNLNETITFDINVVNILGVHTNIKHQVDNNNVKITTSYALPSVGNYYFIGVCTDASGNVTTEQTETIYPIEIYLVNENTGALLTPSDLDSNFRKAIIYTFDGNYSYDFNFLKSTHTKYIGSGEALYLELGYKDTAQTTINRQFSSLYTEDYNIKVCAPFYQTFYQQIFSSSIGQSVTLYSDVSNCYVLAAQMNYANSGSYAIDTYTISKPYYLYTWSEGVKSFLALIQGGIASSYNIDAISFARTQFNVVTGQDTVVFAPLKNTVTGIFDTNIIQIYFKSWNQNYIRSVFTISNAGTNIWTYSDTNSPNEILINFNYTTYGVTDQNVLLLTVTGFYTDGTSNQKSYYFTNQGDAYQSKVNNAWAIIAAVLFFIFAFTMLSVDKAFGFIGILITIVALAILSVSSGAWYVYLMEGIMVIILFFLVLSGKQSGGWSPV